MAKNKITPLKDEPTTSFDELISKIDNLARIINQQNGYLRVIAQKDGLTANTTFSGISSMLPVLSMRH